MRQASNRDLYEQATGDILSLTWSTDALWALRRRGVRDALLVSACKGQLHWDELRWWAGMTPHAVRDGLPVSQCDVPGSSDLLLAVRNAGCLLGVSLWAQGADTASASTYWLGLSNTTLGDMLLSSDVPMPFNSWASTMTALTVESCLSFDEEEVDE